MIGVVFALVFVLTASDSCEGRRIVPDWNENITQANASLKEPTPPPTTRMATVPSTTTTRLSTTRETVTTRTTTTPPLDFSINFTPLWVVLGVGGGLFVFGACFGLASIFNNVRLFGSDPPSVSPSSQTNSTVGASTTTTRFGGASAVAERVVVTVGRSIEADATIAVSSSSSSTAVNAPDALGEFVVAASTAATAPRATIVIGLGDRRCVDGRPVRDVELPYGHAAYEGASTGGGTFNDPVRSPSDDCDGVHFFSPSRPRPVTTCW